MANAVTTGCLLSLMALYFLSNSVASSARGGSQGDSWTRRRRVSLLAQHQRLAGDEGRETDYDSLLRRKRDSAVNGGSDAKLNGGVDGAKWVDSANDLNNSEFPKEEDDDNNAQQSSLLSKDEEVAAKRKWSEKNVRIWGKRKWSSKGLHLWGKRQEDAPSHGAAVERPLEDGGKENGDWPTWERQQNQLHGLVKDAEEMEKRQRWAKNNLKIWGKRNAENEVNADDLEEARMRVLGSAAGEEEHSEEGSPYGNRISGYLQKRNNPPNYGVEQKWGKKGWANNNVRIWG